MQVTKDARFNKETLRFFEGFSKKDKRRFLISALISISGLVSVSAVFLILKNYTLTALLIYIPSAGALFILSAWLMGYCVYRRFYPFDIIIDYEAVTIRNRAGYCRFGRFEIGHVLNSLNRKKPVAVSGAGDAGFEIYPGGLIYAHPNKKKRKRVSDKEKLAYVLMNMAENPQSGINWGVAYASAFLGD